MTMSFRLLITRSAVLAAVTLALAVACSSSSGTRSVSSRPPGSDGSEPGVLDFTAPKLGGGTVDGASFAGQDVAIWFWAPW